MKGVSGADRAGGADGIGGVAFCQDVVERAHNRGQVTHFDGREGNSDFAAYTVGGYWTHFGPTGWYTDAILQGTFYDINSTANQACRNDNDAHACQKRGNPAPDLGPRSQKREEPCSVLRT
jgi:hypothetical protein